MIYSSTNKFYSGKHNPANISAKVRKNLKIDKSASINKLDVIHHFLYNNIFDYLCDMDTMNPLISIIVPVFNVSDYIERCVESIVNQTYTNIEILLIDDASTDGSGEICDRIAANDKRITVIHKEWGGLSHTRNIGMDVARGEWISFVDSDDMIHPDFCSGLLSAALKYKSRIVCCDDIYSNDCNGFTSKRFSSIKFKTLSPGDAIHDVLYQKNIKNSAWSKIYSAEILKDIRFREGILYEDLDFFYRAFERVDSNIAYTPVPLYFYYKRPGSIINTFNNKRLDVIEVTDRICRYMKKYHPELETAAISRSLSANFNMFMLISCQKKKDRQLKKQKDIIWNTIKKLRTKCLLDRNVRMKNKAGIILSYSGKKIFTFICRSVVR